MRVSNIQSWFFSGLFVLMLASACSLPYSRYYLVQDRETWDEIAKRHDLSVEEIKKYNTNKVGSQLKKGLKIYIPYEESKIALVEKGVPLKDFTRTPAEFRKHEFMWPVQNPEISSGFGVRGYRFHEGIDLRDRRHAPVYAAQKGKVIYASSKISGYGRMVIIDHGSGLKTVYAHLQKLSVKEGVEVRRGQTIGSVGSSGKATGTHLHFEVRSGPKAHNPIYYLPPNPSSKIAGTKP